MKKIILILILVFGAVLRLYRISSYPPINADEAAIGYNVYTLIQTGRDEHGNPWPIHFQSFNDYKPGGYFYLVLPFVGFLGLNTLAVRLPAVILSVLTIYLVYKLAYLIWDDEKLGLIWALLLAISPWHLHFSRGGWESSVALFFIILGIYYFYKYLFNSSKYQLLASIFFFIASMYVYHSARIIAPLLFLGLIIFNFKKLWSNYRQLVFPGLIGILIIVPLAVSFLSGGASSRFTGVGLLADPGPFWRANELRGQHQNPQAFLVRLVHNQYLEYGLSFAENYFSHFDVNFLFLTGDEVPRSKVPDMGVMHLISSLGLVTGGWWWIKNKKIKSKYLPVILILVSPLASAMTFQAPSALRALTLVIPLSFFTAYGIKQFLDFKKLRVVGYGLLIIGYTFSTFFWFNSYFNRYLEEYPTAWPLGYKEAAAWMTERPEQEFVVVTDHDQPYILTAFYTQFDPLKMQQEIELTPPDEYGFSTVNQFDRFKFANQPPENATMVKEFPGTRIYEEN